MAWIEKMPVAEATGSMKRIFDDAIKRAGKVYEIVHLQSQNGAVLLASIEMYKATMYGRSPVTRQQREMIATVVSSINRCHY